MPINRDGFQNELDRILENNNKSGKEFIDILSGKLHRTIGGYPSKNHSMPTCCDVMRSNMKIGDEILHSPPKGKRASLLIRYYFPH